MLLLLSAFVLTTAQTNYEGIKLFVINYMTAFEGSQFNSSSICFNPVTTSKLDADFVAMEKSLLFGKTEDFVMYYDTFVTDLQAALWKCQVGDIKAAFDYNVQKHGFEFIVGNVFWRALDIYGAALKAFGDMMALDYASAATNLGMANRYVSPPKPVNATMRLGFDPTVSVNFSLGLAYGLEVYQTEAGPCFMQLGNVFPIVPSIVQDILSLVHGNGNPETLTIHIASLITALTLSAPLCDYNTFFPTIEQLTLKQVLTNLGNHWSYILADAKDLKNCHQDVFKCGQNIGEIIRFTLTWGLYAPQPRVEI